MMSMFSKDIDNAIEALEYVINEESEKLSSQNAGDREWRKVHDLKATLTNLQFISAIYGE